MQIQYCGIPMFLLRNAIDGTGTVSQEVDIHQSGIMKKHGEPDGFTWRRVFIQEGFKVYPDPDDPTKGCTSGWGPGWLLGSQQEGQDIDVHWLAIEGALARDGAKPSLEGCPLCTFRELRTVRLYATPTDTKHLDFLETFREETGIPCLLQTRTTAGYKRDFRSNYLLAEWLWVVEWAEPCGFPWWDRPRPPEDPEPPPLPKPGTTPPADASPRAGFRTEGLRVGDITPSGWRGWDATRAGEGVFGLKPKRRPDPAKPPGNGDGPKGREGDGDSRIERPHAVGEEPPGDGTAPRRP